jgi:DNA-3-methyladenine glycosylase I
VSRVRCAWAGDDPAMCRYHDEEWGVPFHDDRHWFEMLVLEGFQAGLSWRTILHKRDAFRDAFAGFDPARVASFTDADVDRLLADPRIVRNGAKIRATIANAQAFLRVQQELGSFDALAWASVGGSPVLGRRRTQADVPAVTEASTALAGDLKQRGFRFVGPTVAYAFMQATGLVNDHTLTCFRYAELAP